MNSEIVSAIVGGIVAIAGLIFRARTVRKKKRNKEKEVITSLKSNYSPKKQEV